MDKELVSSKNLKSKMMSKHNIQNLIAHVGNGNQPKYLFFWGHKSNKKEVTKACFSQWFVLPFEVEGITYASAEHYMMASKARLFDDLATLEKIINCAEPANAKKLGRQIKGYIEEDWLAHRFQVVVTGNLAKFSQHTELKNFLLNTKERVIVEASPVDHIWGIGMAQDDPGVNDPRQWQGLNLLGFALMEVRDQLGLVGHVNIK